MSLGFVEKQSPIAVASARPNNPSNAARTSRCAARAWTASSWRSATEAPFGHMMIDVTSATAAPTATASSRTTPTCQPSGTMRLNSATTSSANIACPAPKEIA